MASHRANAINSIGHSFDQIISLRAQPVDSIGHRLQTHKHFHSKILQVSDGQTLAVDNHAADLDENAVWSIRAIQQLDWRRDAYPNECSSQMKHTQGDQRNLGETEFEQKRAETGSRNRELL